MACHAHLPAKPAARTPVTTDSPASRAGAGSAAGLRQAPEDADAPEIYLPSKAPGNTISVLPKALLIFLHQARFGEYPGRVPRIPLGGYAAPTQLPVSAFLPGPCLRRLRQALYAFAGT